MKNDRNNEMERVVTEKYNIRNRIGYGVHGSRYVGYVKKTGKKVAIKQIPKGVYSNDECMRILMGINMHKKLKHRCLCDVIEMIETTEFIYLVTNFVEGRTLQSIVAGEGSLPHDEVVIILRQVAELIAFLHEKSSTILYCDLRPVNFIYTPQGGIVVIDFEGAMPKNDATELRNGYPGFSAPEQINGMALDERTDVFGVGALAFYLLTGHTIFDEDGQMNQDGSYSTLVGYYEPSLSGSLLEGFIDRCLSYDPQERYRNGRELINALSQIKRANGNNFILGFSGLLFPNKKKPVIESHKTEKSRPYEVFLSFHHTERGKETKDCKMASVLYMMLSQMGVNAFFSYVNGNLGDYGGTFPPAIYNALDEASILIVVGSKPEYLNRKWIQREINTFQGIKDNRPGKEDSAILCYLDKKVKIKDLPANLITNSVFNDINELVSVVCKKLSKPLKEKVDIIGGLEQFEVDSMLEDRYRMESEMERNKDNVLFIAHDRHIGQKVMVRICTGNETFYREEFELLSKAGPLTGIPHITDKDEYNGYVYYVTEYLSGPSLAVLKTYIGSFTEMDLRYWMIQILTILNNMHGQDTPLYHGNIKLSTVIVNHRQISLTSPHITAKGNSAKKDIQAVGDVMCQLISRHNRISDELYGIIDKCKNAYETCDEAIKDLERL